MVRTGIIDRPCFDANSDLKVIANRGAGFDDFEVAEAVRRGIRVFAPLLAIGKRTLYPDALVRRGNWRRAIPRATQLCGRTMGIVGYGAISERMAALAAAFGMRAIEFDSERANRISRQVWRRVALAELLEECDLASLHVPPTDTTRNMIDAAALASMKRGSILVNAAREGIVDEVSLVDAVDSGRLQGAGHDKFAMEPPGESFAAARCNGILLSPQIAGATDESAPRMSMCCAQSVEQFLMQGTRSDSLVNFSWDARC
ncbi:MAG: hypothetical protein OXN84_12910 [Albidovulum sp.]|nr:hypothetical protein [Albidovulum sp.]